MTKSESYVQNTPDGKVHEANMEPTWALSAPDVPHVGPMNIAIGDSRVDGDCRRNDAYVTIAMPKNFTKILAARNPLALITCVIGLTSKTYRQANIKWSNAIPNAFNYNA